MTSAETKLSKSYKSLMIIVIIVVALIVAGDLIMPLLFSGMLAILLNPFHNTFEKKGIPRGLAALLVVLILSIVFFILIFIIVIQSQEIVKEIPKFMEEQESLLNLDTIKNYSIYIFEYLKEHLSTIEENMEEITNTTMDFLKQGIIGVQNTLVFLILCPIYIFFMLLCKENIYQFIRSYHPKKDKKEDDVINNVKNSLYKYLKGLFIVMTISGFLTFIGLYFVGIEYALFLGVLTAILTPIPYIGVIISASIPLLLAILTKDSYWYTIGVLIVFIVVQFLEGYVLTPKIMGDNVNINPLTIVVGLIIIGTLTGIIGLIMTVPLLATTKVIIDYFPHLKPWKHLIEDKSKA